MTKEEHAKAVLTERQFEVFCLAHELSSINAIARRLGITRVTARQHLERAQARLEKAKMQETLSI